MSKLEVQESFSRRYLVKIVSSVLIALLNVIVQLLLPRVFTIEEYGYYSYNLNVFSSVVAVFNLSTSNALISKFSKKNDEDGYVHFYLRFFAIISLLLNIGIILLFPTSFIHASFTGQTIFVILLGLNASIVRKLLTDMVSVFDAMALSRLPALWQIIQKIIITICVVGGYYFSILNIYVFYIFQITTIGGISLFLIVQFFCIHKNKYKVSLRKQNVEYISEFFVFCRPLVFATIFDQISILAKNWALMHWSGISSSALFGAAWQLNIIISYIFSPYAELMKREFAVIHRDTDELNHRIIQSLKIMAWLISFFCIFIVINANDVLMFLFGQKYSNAVLITQVIMIYTIYQAWGQILGSFMLALEKTRASSIISMLANCLSVLLIYFLQCPNFIWKNGLGVNGMAFSYAIVNYFSVSLLLFYVTKIMKLSFFKLSSIPLLSMTICFIISFSINSVFMKLIPDNSQIVRFLRLMCGGFSYSIIIMLLIWNCPKIIGIDKKILIMKLPFKKKP